jgi:hypothetical protein
MIKALFYFASVIVLFGCKTIDKKIIGSWYIVESNYDLVNNDSLFKFISTSPEIQGNYKAYPTITYSIDRTFHCEHSDYKESGTYAFKGDTLILMSFDTNYQIIYRINKNVYVSSDARYTYKHYFYSIKKNKLEKLIKKN